MDVNLKTMRNQRYFEGMKGFVVLHQMSFGKNLRLWRERLGLSLADVAEASGLAVSTVSQIETGKQRPHNTSKKLLAEAIGKKVEDLLRPPPGVEEEKPVFRLREWLESPDAEIAPGQRPSEKDKRVIEALFWEQLKKDEGKN